MGGSVLMSDLTSGSWTVSVVCVLVWWLLMNNNAHGGGELTVKWMSKGRNLDPSASS